MQIRFMDIYVSREEWIMIKGRNVKVREKFAYSFQ